MSHFSFKLSKEKRGCLLSLPQFPSAGGSPSPGRVVNRGGGSAVNKGWPTKILTEGQFKTASRPISLHLTLQVSSLVPDPLRCDVREALHGVGPAGPVQPLTVAINLGPAKVGFVARRLAMNEPPYKVG